MGEILNWEDAVNRRKKFTGTVVFTNGVFDIIHRGHVDYLKKAKELGDLLIVGLNSDQSARSLAKGTGRPFNTSEDRASVLSNITPVDMVVIFDQPTPKSLVEKIEPDILVKGGDYKISEVVGRETVESRGGKVVIIPLTPGKSTTSLVDKIYNSGL